MDAAFSAQSVKIYSHCLLTIKVFGMEGHTVVLAHSLLKLLGVTLD